MKRVAVLALGLLLTMGSTQVFAQTQDPKAAELCTPDVMRLCNEFVPDVDQITTCMQAKRRQLSPECRAVFKPKHRRHAPTN